MKIAYISGRMFSDVDISFLSHAQKLMDITYFVPIYPNGLKGAAFNIHKQFPKYGVFKASTIYPELEKFTNLIDPNKFYIINSPALRMWHPKNLWLQFKMMLKLWSYDIIHITDFPYYYEWFYYFLRKKIVLTVHDPIPHSTKACNTFQIKLNRKVGFYMLRHFIILNKNQERECIKLNKLQNKAIYDSRLGCYDYLNLYKTNSHNTKQHILFFGQIASNKGLDILLPAMQEVHMQYPDAKLIIAGKGDFHFDITPYEDLDYIDIQNRFIPDQELANLIQDSVFVVCPYKDATQSGVVMSAFAYNKPVIATNVGGFPEQVVHNQYGLIVPPSNIHALATAIVHLYKQNNLIQTFEKNIEEDYHHGHLSWEHIVCDMLKIYQAVIAH